MKKTIKFFKKTKPAFIKAWFILMMFSPLAYAQAQTSLAVTLAQQENRMTNPTNTFFDTSHWVSEESSLVGIYDKCPVAIPSNHFALAESFFQNFDYTIRRVAFLRAYGFKETTYIHTSCQDSDVKKDLYVVLIKGAVADKAMLYKETALAYEQAVKQGIELINTRIIYYN